MKEKESLFHTVQSIDTLTHHFDVDQTLFAYNEKRGSRLFENKMFPPRHVYAFIILTIFFFICLIQLFFLQMMHGDHYYKLAMNNRVRETAIPAPRGIITDRQGVPLAFNTPSFHLYLNYLFFESTPDRKKEILSIVENMISAPIHLAIDTQENIDTYSISTTVPYDIAMRLLAWNDRYPEYTVESTSTRTYITDRVPSLSHVVGYIGNISKEQYDEKKKDGYRIIDNIGQTGIEFFYEQILRGTPGKKQTEVNAHNEVQRVVSLASPIAGQDMALTIDASLQSEIETILKKRLPAVGHERASVIVMNPNDGAILALTSWPAYDANTFVRGNTDVYAKLLANEDHPLFHRAISGVYPSGSTIKPIYLVGALMENIITPTTSFLSNGGLQVGPWFFPDWKQGGHGMTNAYKAIAESVNTFFYIIGGGYDTFEGLGIDRLLVYAKLFGLSQVTGIDETGESTGFLPSPEWKQAEKGERWYVGDTYNVAIGQGDVLVTPLQMARAVSVFANNGYLVTPHLWKEANHPTSRIIPENSAKIVQEAMRQTVTSGTAKTLQALPVTSAGKTGTAQWSQGKANHSWFIGYAPYEHPEVTIVVLIEEDKTGYAAVPVVYDILRFWFDENNDRGTI